MSATLSVYFGERKRFGRQLVADALLSRFAAGGVDTSVLLRGVEGFGLKHHLRSDTSLSLSDDLPAVAFAVGPDAPVEALADEVRALVPTGLIGLQHIGAEPTEGAVRLISYVGRRARTNGSPAFRAVTALLYARRVAGATALLGVDGTSDGTRLRARFFAGNGDVPVMITAIGTAEEFHAVRSELAAVAPTAVHTTQPVQICKRDGVVIAQPDVDAEWFRLTLYGSAATLHEGVPVHRAVVRRLRRDGVRGATTLRGVWGFHGAHAPHGDHVLQLGRRVPVVTSVVERADRLASAFAAMDGLTTERGLITCEPMSVVNAEPAQ